MKFNMRYCFQLGDDTGVDGGKNKKGRIEMKLIKTQADYQTTLSRIEKIFNAKPGTPEGDELDLLVTLVELYEEMVEKQKREK